MIILLSAITVILASMCVILALRLSKSSTREALLNERLRVSESKAAAEEKNMNERFANLANRIFSDTSRTFKEQNEQRLSEILSPLKEDIAKFSKTVNDTYQTEARERFSLSERIKELVALNQSISRQAKDLSEALRGNSKVQGDWGEMILDTLLEKSGLKRGVHYTVQTTRDSEGRVIRDDLGNHLRPDVIINYPDGRCMIIDSKVSLTAYINFVNSDDNAAATRFGEQHLTSIKSHIKELATKNYQDYIGEKRADFVMMFIPNEGAYLTAMNLDPSLWEQAYDSRVIIISPTHLLSALKLVQQLWQQDDVKRNAAEIALEAGKMYDKFAGFVDDMAKIEKSLDNARASYDAAINKLSTGRGNLIKRAADMKRLGARAQKNLPQTLVENSEEE